MSNNIEHLGIVENIEGRHITVRIVQTSACSTCVAASHCNASESKVKLIDVFSDDSNNYTLGESVRLIGSASMGMQAVLWAFGAPFVVLIVVLLLMQMVLGMSEVPAALVAMGSLVPYYFVLYLLRDRMSGKFSFIIEPIK